MYSFQSRVRYSETDEEGKLSLAALMNYFQDCTIFQAEALGVGPARLAERNRAWLLSGWQIVIDRYPAMFENITIGTIPYDFSGGLGWRNFIMTDSEGNYLVRANSTWLFYDTAEGRPVRPDEEELQAYRTEPRIEMDYAPRRLVMPKEMERLDPVPVMPHHLDTNHHVNNVQYVEIARELISETFTVREVRVAYKRQAHLGDLLFPKMKKEGEWVYVSLSDESGQDYALVAMRMGQKGSLC